MRFLEDRDLQDSTLGFLLGLGLVVVSRVCPDMFCFPGDIWGALTRYEVMTLQVSWPRLLGLRLHSPGLRVQRLWDPTGFNRYRKLSEV